MTDEPYQKRRGNHREYARADWTAQIHPHIINEPGNSTTASSSVNRTAARRRKPT
ncbi:hypothetical protein ACQPYA_03915 [Micromonospora sp. CA-263727]|uniref:hypothetical protein n=1 Tax=Micromonospora sp. CA-263727 TaxID=3239967 RepID=UPI003D8C27E4